MHESIRQAGSDDAVTLANVIRQSFQDVAARFALTSANCPTHPSNCTPDWIRTAFSKSKRYFLLEVDNQPAGCIAVASATSPAGQIERLAVPPQVRRRGYGDRLLQHAIQTLRDLGMSRAELSIIADHADLQAWYERRGFAVTAIRQFPQLPFAVAFMAATI